MASKTEVCSTDQIDNQFQKTVAEKIVESYNNRVLNAFHIATTFTSLSLSALAFIISFMVYQNIYSITILYINFFFVLLMFAGVVLAIYYINTLNLVIPICTNRNVNCRHGGRFTNKEIACKKISDNCIIIKINTKIKIKKRIMNTNILNPGNVLFEAIDDILCKTLKIIQLDE